MTILLKRVLVHSFVTLLLSLISLGALAAIDVYEFEDVSQEKRFHVLMEELRCPKCQNQNLADSNAGLARDLKTRAYTLLKEGKSNQDIVDYMVERYGDFVTYRPPLRPTTWLLWFGPFFILLLAGFLLLRRTWRISKEIPEKTELDRERLNQVLQQYKDDETE